MPVIDSLTCCTVQNGLTALSIAQRLGYISVVEILRHITDVTVTTTAVEDKYKVIAPETMQEAPMSDSEEEGGVWFTSCITTAFRGVYNIPQDAGEPLEHRATVVRLLHKRLACLSRFPSQTAKENLTELLNRLFQDGVVCW